MLIPEMFATLEKAYCLPSYTGGLAQMFATMPSPVPARTFRFNRQVLDFVDIEGIQAKGTDHSCNPSQL